MSKKIIFQKCNFNYIYFLLYIIMQFANIFIEYKFELKKEEVNVSPDKYFLPAQIINDFYIHNISDFLAIIPYFIRKKILKKKEKNINMKIDDSSLIYNDNKTLVTNKKKKTILFYLILIGILDFLQKFATTLYSIIYKDKQISIYNFSSTSSLEIISQFICSYIILKIHFYKLQKLSFILNLGIFIIILIIDIINAVKFIENDIKSYFFWAFNIIFYSIEYSYAKKSF